MHMTNGKQGIPTDLEPDPFRLQYSEVDLSKFIKTSELAVSHLNGVISIFSVDIHICGASVAWLRYFPVYAVENQPLLLIC
jgi:hypothetical protein